MSRNGGGTGSGFGDGERNNNNRGSGGFGGGGFGGGGRDTNGSRGLFSGDKDYMNDDIEGLVIDQRSRLLQGNDRLDDHTDRLARAHRLGKESEDIGVEIQTTLGHQTEVLLSAKDKVTRIDKEMDVTKGLLFSIFKRMITNKLILLLLIIIFLVLLVVYLCYNRNKSGSTVAVSEVKPDQPRTIKIDPKNKLKTVDANAFVNTNFEQEDLATAVQEAQKKDELQPEIVIQTGGEEPKNEEVVEKPKTVVEKPKPVEKPKTIVEKPKFTKPVKIDSNKTIKPITNATFNNDFEKEEEVTKEEVEKRIAKN